MRFAPGIRPTRPDTGYGYIQYFEKENSKGIHKSKKHLLREKPEKAVAKQFLEKWRFSLECRHIYLKCKAFYTP